MFSLRKKLSKRFAVSLLSVAALAVVLLQGINLIQINDSIRLLLLRKLAPYLEGRITIDRLAIGWFSAHIMGLSVVSSDNSYDVNINDISIKFKPGLLLKNRFDFTKSVSSISIIKPEIIVRIVNENESIPVPQKPQSIRNRIASPNSVSPAIDFRSFPVDSLDIKDGVIIVHGKSLKIFSVNSINGVLGIDSGEYRFSLNGSLLNAGKSLQINGRANPSFSEYNFTGKIDSAIVSHPVNLNKFQISSGLLSAEFSVKKHSSMSLQFSDISGNATLSRVRAIYNENISVDNISSSLRISDNTIYIDSLNATSSGLILKTKGHISNLFNPWITLNVAVTGKSSLPSSLIRALPFNNVNIGQIGSEISLSGSIEEPEISGMINVGSISADDKIGIQRLHALFSTSRDTIVFFPVSATANSGKLSAAIRIPLKRPSSARYQINIRNANLSKLTNIDNTTLSFLAIESADTASRNHSTRIRGAIKSEALADIGELSFSLERFADHWGISAANDSASLALTGRYLPAPSNSGRFQITTNSFPIPNIKGIKISGDAHFNYKDNTVRILANQIYKSKPASGELHLTGTYDFTNHNVSAKLFADTFTIYGARAELSASIDKRQKSFSVSKIRFGNLVSGNFSINDAQKISGTLNISRYDFSNIELVPPFSDDSRGLDIDGKLEGNVDFSGTVNNPFIAASLDLSKGRLGKAKDVSAKLNIRGTSSAFILKDFIIETPSQRLLWSDSLAFSNGTLSGRIESGRLDLSKFWPDTSVRGSVYMRIDASHKGYTEIITAAEKIFMGSVGLNSLKANIIERKGIAEIRELTFASRETIGEATGIFTLPFTSDPSSSKEDTVNLVIFAQGNILKEITGFLPLFNRNRELKSTGQGNMRLHLVGNSSNLLIRSGTIDISRDPTATIFPSAVFQKLNKFKANLAIEKGFAQFDAEGYNGSKRIRISNVPAPSGKEPIIVEGINLNLGILRIETPDGFISANAPGFMPEKENAEFELSGRNNEGHMTIEGPLKSPLLKGDIRIRNGKFTFPLLTQSKGDNTIDLNLDLYVKVAQNLKYYYYQNTVTPWLNKVFRNETVTAIGKTISDFFQYPLTELELDRQSFLKITGSPSRKTLRLNGRISSYKGYIHYAGNDFRNDIDVELEFDGSKDLRPIISASAKTILRSENRSEASNEISLRLYVKDPRTGADIVKGRFNEIKLVPSSTDQLSDPYSSTSSTYQQLLGAGSDNANVQGNIGRFAMSEGRAMFEKVFMQRLFTNYVERTVLGFGREVINPIVGLNVTPDVFRIEIESNSLINYIDLSFWNWQQFRKDLLEKTEFITGKYFFNGSLFLNYSSQLDLVAAPEGLEIEKLHHRLGLEITPWRYLYFNMDYEISSLTGAVTGRFEPDAFRSQLRLRLPIKKIQQVFEKEERTSH